METAILDLKYTSSTCVLFLLLCILLTHVLVLAPEKSVWVIAQHDASGIVHPVNLLLWRHMFQYVNSHFLWNGKNNAPLSEQQVVSCCCCQCVNMTVNQHGWIILPLILMHGHAFSPFVIIHDLLSVFSLSLRRLHVTLCCGRWH